MLQVVTTPLPRSVAPSLPSAQAALDRLAASCRAFMDLAARGERSPDFSYHRVVSLVHAILADVERAEQGGAPREALRHVLADVHAVHGRSPFVRRLRERPADAPTDLELVAPLSGHANHAPDLDGSNRDTLENFVERMAQGTFIAEQHRHKVQARAQGQEIARAVRSRAAGRPARVLDLACGTARGAGSVLADLVPHPFRLVLSDRDPAALALAEARLAPLADRCEFVAGRPDPAALAARGPFDLVVTGSMFDHLDERAAADLIAALAGRALAPGGELLFTVMTRGNPFRAWMEHFADRDLHERDEADVRRLLQRAGVSSRDAEVRPAGTGLALSVVVRAPHTAAR